MILSLRRVSRQGKSLSPKTPQATASTSLLRVKPRSIASGKMTIMLDVANSLTQTLNLETLMGKIIAKVSEILNAERSTLFLLDRERNELWSKVAQGSEVAEIRVPSSAGLARHVASTGELLNIKNAYEDERFDQTIDRETGYRTVGVLCAPLYNRGGEVIGVTQAINKKDGMFDTEDEDLLQAISAQISIALGRKASRSFREAADVDRPCRIFLDRCQHFLESPPTPPWDKVWVSKEK